MLLTCSSQTGRRPAKGFYCVSSGVSVGSVYQGFLHKKAPIDVIKVVGGGHRGPLRCRAQALHAPWCGWE